MEQLQSRGLAYVDEAARATAEFYRLFLAPGMGHCSGGPGATPSDLGQAIEKWVERNEAPASLLAVRNAGGVAGKGFTRGRSARIRKSRATTARACRMKRRASVASRPGARSICRGPAINYLR